MKYLKLHLSSPLQYFATTPSVVLNHDAQTSNRPTKRAIIGLIASALGIDRDDVDSLQNLTDSLIVKEKSNSIPMIVKDTQTVRPLRCQTYYANKYYKKAHPFKLSKAKGGVKADNEQCIFKTVIYLQNADFTVFVGSEDETVLQKIYDALRNPVYALYIGKRSCVPNKPLTENTFTVYQEEDFDNVYDCV